MVTITQTMLLTLQMSGLSVKVIRRRGSKLLVRVGGLS